MARFYEALTPELIDFIGRQRLFFVASAVDTGRVSVSPKGADTLRVLNDREIAYADLTGSGAETIAHAHAGGRVTFLFCSFEEKPLILRLYGQAEALTPDSHEGRRLLETLPPQPATRQVLRLHIESVQTSCGYAVPLFEYLGERETYPRWVDKKGEAGIAAYWRERNHTSIDGLPVHLRPDSPCESTGDAPETPPQQ